MTPMPGAPGMPNARPRGTSLGTGFIISSDGYVLTNHHVVDGADTVRIKLSDRREFTAKVVGSDEQSDVALLKINATGLPVMRVGDSKQLKPGQWVVAIGSPWGVPIPVPTSATCRSFKPTWRSTKAIPAARC
jgi:serine protease Do